MTCFVLSVYRDHCPSVLFDLHKKKNGRNNVDISVVAVKCEISTVSIFVFLAVAC